MKKQILIASLLAGSIVGLSACNSVVKHVHSYWDPIYKDENTHVSLCYDCDETVDGYYLVEEHHWDEGRITSTPSHLEEGKKVYTCVDCLGEKEEVLPKTSEHTFNKKVTNPIYLASEPTCTTPAAYFYSCVCGEKGTETFVTGTYLPHEVTSIVVKSDTSKKTYSSFEEYDPTGLALSYVCAKCGNHDIDMDEVVFEYQFGNSSFRCGETKITAKYEGFGVEIEGFNVSRIENTIVGLEDFNISCGEQIDFSQIKSLHGEYTVTVKNKNNEEVTGEELENLTFENSPYTVTVDVPQSSEYNAIKDTKTITVNHNFILNTSKKLDLCACGRCVVEEVFYDKDTAEVYYEGAIGDIASSLDPSTFVNEDGNPVNFASYSSEVSVPVQTTIGEKTYHFAVIVADKVIDSLDEMKSTFQLSSDDERLDGYFVLGKDIDGKGFNYVGERVFTWTWSGARYGTAGFRGVFDGRGRTVSNFQLVGDGVGGMFTYVGYNGVVKNVNFTHITHTGWYRYASITYYAYHSTFENILMQFDSYADYTGHVDNQAARCNPIVALRSESNCIFKDITIDAKGLTLGNLCPGWVHDGLAFDNYTVICKAYYVLGIQGGVYSNYLGGNNSATALASMPEGAKYIQA